MIGKRGFDSHSLRHLHDFVRQPAILDDFARWHSRGQASGGSIPLSVTGGCRRMAVREAVFHPARPNILANIDHFSQKVSG
jgi:hypothetical protein